MSNPTITLYELHHAIDIVTRVHTADDKDIGFIIHTAVQLELFTDMSTYLDAWKILRNVVAKQTQPRGTTTQRANHDG